MGLAQAVRSHHSGKGVGIPAHHSHKVSGITRPHHSAKAGVSPYHSGKNMGIFGGKCTNGSIEFESKVRRREGSRNESVSNVI